MSGSGWVRARAGFFSNEWGHFFSTRAGRPFFLVTEFTWESTAGIEFEELLLKKVNFGCFKFAFASCI